jgi:hypothetical protein
LTCFCGGHAVAGIAVLVCLRVHEDALLTSESKHRKQQLQLASWQAPASKNATQFSLEFLQSSKQVWQVKLSTTFAYGQIASHSPGRGMSAATLRFN